MYYMYMYVYCVINRCIPDVVDFDCVSNCFHRHRAKHHLTKELSIS